MLLLLLLLLLSNKCIGTRSVSRQRHKANNTDYNSNLQKLAQESESESWRGNSSSREKASATFWSFFVWFVLSLSLSSYCLLFGYSSVVTWFGLPFACSLWLMLSLSVSRSSLRRFVFARRLQIRSCSFAFKFTLTLFSFSFYFQPTPPPLLLFVTKLKKVR